MRELNIKFNQQGISVLLSILILSSLVVMTLAVSDIVLRVGRSSRHIGQSEIAHYTAETAVEKALYQIERNRTVTDLDGANGVLEDIADASWSRAVAPITTFSIQCGDGVGELSDSEEGVCADTAGDDLDNGNSLNVQLNAGSSFQLELDFSGLTLPTDLTIRKISGDGKVIVLNTNASSQSVYTPPPPLSLSNLDTELYVVRIVNDSGAFAAYRINPPNPPAGILPVGIEVIGTGTYKNEQRILEIERSNWQIY